jgi:hypothetical protein
MKRLFIAVRFSLMLGIPALLVVAAMAQAPQPAISDAAGGSIPSGPGMYVQAGMGSTKCSVKSLRSRAAAAYSYQV